MSEKNLSNNIPVEFTEVDNYDHQNRLLKAVYVLQNDESWKRIRLALVKAGNIFKMVDSLEENEDSYETIYRAIRDAQFDKKQNSIIIECTTLGDYNEEINLKEYTFQTPTYDPCRD